jgi:hypothetical protein
VEREERGLEREDKNEERDGRREMKVSGRETVLHLISTNGVYDVFPNENL